MRVFEDLQHAPQAYGLGRRFQRAASAFLVENFFEGISRAGRLNPWAKPARWDVQLHRDIPYRDSGSADHHLDIYQPNRPGPWPVAIYIHGGGFRKLSKDTHWIMGLAFSRRGYLTYHLNYRLGADNPYPAPLEDVARAYLWAVNDARSRGGDVERLVVAGESAGANLTTALAIMTSYRRAEPFARELFDAGIAPKVAAPACGYLQTSDTERFIRDPKIPNIVVEYIRMCSEAYRGHRDPPVDEAMMLADPLVFLERGHAPDRPLPAFFTGVGTLDPLYDDTLRLAKALERLGVRHEARLYRGGMHAFHVFLWERRARQFWKDKFAFIDGVM